MKAVFCLLALVSFTSAHPFYKGLTGGLTSGLTGCLTKSLSKSLSKVVKLPSIIPKGYNIVEFDSQAATKAIQGYWYVTLATPSYYDIRSKKTGLFRNVWPCSSNVVSFEDTTPGNPFDYNTDYVMNQYSYNVYTGEVEKSRGLLSSAYGQSKYAIFNVYVEDIFDEPLVEVQPLLDQTLNIHKVDSMYNRLFTVGVIGADSDSYMVFAVLNEYNNVFNIKDKHTIWVLTRDSNPSSDVTNRAINDIVNSGLSPYYLIDIDHSVDLISKGLILNGISSVTDEYSVSKTVSESSTTKSFSVSHGDKCYSASTTETKSTVEYTTEISSLPDYQPFLPFVSNPFVPDVKIMSEFASDVLAKAMKGKYYVNSATPFVAYEDCCKIGLFHTVFPAKSLQVIFDNTVNTPWDWTKEYMMVDRGINRKTGKIDVTKSIIYSTFGPNSRYPIFTVATEGYYNEVLEDVVKITNTGFYAHTVSTTFKRNYYLAVIGFREDDYLILYTVNSYNNLLFANKPVHNVYVLTKARQPSSKTLADIAQDILLSGYDLNTLITIDQSDDIMDIYKFNPADFELSVTSNDSSSSDEKSTIKSLTSSASNLLSSISSATKSLSESTSSKTISTEVSIKLPAIIPTTYKVQPFDTTIATKVFNGNWYVNMATPVCIKNDRIKHTGLLANTWPNSGNVIHFRENTPWDFDVDCTLTEYSYNWITDKVETTRSLFKSAYGNLYPYAIFNFYTEGYYENSLKEIHPLIDEHFVLPSHKVPYTMKYTALVIGADYDDYLVFVVLNEWDNYFTIGNDNRLIWIMTREQSPKSKVVKRAIQDIIDSGLNPYYLMAVDQSVDIVKKGLPVVSDFIKEVTTTKSESTTSTSSKSVSISDCENLACESKTETRTSIEYTTEVTLLKSYKPFCSFISVPFVQGVKILNDFDAINLHQALHGKYYVFLATPYAFNINVPTCGLFYTLFPTSGLQVIFDNTVSLETPWDWTREYMMVDRAYNRLTGQVELTKSLIYSTFGPNNNHGLLTVATEGYYEDVISDVVTISEDGISVHKCAKIYRRNYQMAIAGYQPKEYLILYVVNKYNNIFLNQEIHNMYVLTRDQVPSHATIDKITQDLILNGYDTRNLMSIDQSYDITDDYTFVAKEYEVSYEDNTSSVTSTSSSIASLASSLLSSVSSASKSLSVANSSENISKNIPIKLPSIIPRKYKVQPFDVNTAAKVFNGDWYVNMATPVCMKNDRIKHTGLLANTWPNSGNVIHFRENTPWDFNVDCTLTEYSYNWITNKIESTRSLFKSAYGNLYASAIFNFYSEGYYAKSLVEIHPLIDEHFVLPTHKVPYTVKYTAVIIGADYDDYLVIVILNEWKNKFITGNNNHLIWVMTRQQYPSKRVISCAVSDITRSGLNPNYLITVDQSVDIIKKGLPEVADFVSNEITTKKTVSTTTSTKSVSVSDCGNTVTASKTETKTTVEYSTDVAPLESYQPFCPFVSIPFVNKIRIINDFDATTLSKALYGKYYVALATPYAFNIDSPKCGLFYTAFPTASLQVIFENTLPIDTPWDWSRDYMMLDRAINRQTGEIESTRSILYSTFGPEGNHGLLTVATEGYYDEVMTEVGSIDEDNIIHHHFADIYRRHYYMAITGYKEGEYLILYIVNSYRNIFYQNKNTHNMYVLTRDRIPSSDTINSITQDILLSGYNPKDLIKIDQTYNIRDEVIFNAEEYEVTYEISTVLEETSSSVSRQSSYYGTAVKSDYGYY
ncbi:uncharacterized protein LOC126896499 isoform X2 [Daktulosphaira vitifoliae]|uniref:uncharacterized protein LOC126896499 isoform X2 n=1 Tax=Daktulosphaira vitifoliae TaxID=58002 RepID=UPI0021A99572|nr:uncharacterized protein LOC126896499 isoform X2 [Daktulosphaira vitifoliae]